MTDWTHEWTNLILAIATVATVVTVLLLLLTLSAWVEKHRRSRKVWTFDCADCDWTTTATEMDELLKRARLHIIEHDGDED